MNKIGGFRRKTKKAESEISVDIEEKTKLKAIWNVCRENDYHVIQSILKTYSADAIPLWDAIRDCLTVDGTLYFIVREFIKIEVEKTRDFTQLFRANSGISNLMSSIMRVEAKEVLMNYIDDVIKTVNSITIELELDPDKVAVSDAEASASLIMEILKTKIMKFDVIENWISPSLKYIFSFIREEVAKKFPNSGVISIGGFFFLRFLNPALLSPQRFGDFITRPNEVGHQALLYLTKMIQVMANQTPNPFKEDHMKQFNDYCVDHYDYIKTFLAKISEKIEQPPIKRVTDDLTIMNKVPNIMRAILGFRDTVLNEFKEELNKVRGLEEKLFGMIRSNTTYEKFVYFEESDVLPEVVDTLKNNIMYYEKKVNTLSERILDLYHFISNYIPDCDSLKDISTLVQQTRKKNLNGEIVEKMFNQKKEEIEPETQNQNQEEQKVEETPVLQEEFEEEEEESSVISASSELSEEETGETIKRKYKDVSDDGEWSRSDSEDFVEKYKPTYKLIVDEKERRTQGPSTKPMKMSVTNYKAFLEEKYKIPDALVTELKTTIHAFHRLLHKCHRCDDAKRLYHTSVELIIVIQKFTGKKTITTQHKDCEADINMIPTTRDLIDRLCKMFIERLHTDQTLTIEHFKRVQNYINDDVIKYIKEEYDDIVMQNANQ